MSEMTRASGGAGDSATQHEPHDPALRALLDEMEGLAEILPPYRGPLPRRDDGRRMGAASA